MKKIVWNVALVAGLLMAAPAMQLGGAMMAQNAQGKAEAENCLVQPTNLTARSYASRPQWQGLKGEITLYMANDLGRNGYYDQKTIAELMGEMAGTVDPECVIAAGVSLLGTVDVEVVWVGWAEDAARRDFTFNALYADFDGTVYDYCGGVRDLNDGRVRFIGDPVRRIGEDYLRILRYFRFLAQFNAEPDAATLDACRSGSDGLSRLSLDRTRRELFKLVESDNAVHGLTAMNDAGLPETYFPAQGLPVLNRLLRLFPAAPLTFRLAALYGVTVDGANAAAQRWQLSKAQRKAMMSIAAFDRSKPPENYT